MRPGIAYLSLFMTPIFLEIVFDIQSMWFFHVKHSSMSTPRNLVNFTLSSKVSFNVILKSWCVLVDVILWVPIIIKLVLLAFTDNLFALNQLLTFQIFIHYINFAAEVFVRIKNSGIICKQNEVKYIWCIRYIINIEYK